MRRLYICVALSAVIALGCARLRVEAPKEPIKVDVSMRIDVYQHIQKDINTIEDIVSGSGGEVSSTGQQSMLDLFIVSAYAQEDLDAAIKEAALRRKGRLPELQSLMSQGIIGEDKFGLLEIIKASDASSVTEGLVAAENYDRMLIYKELARKNNTPLGDIQGIYALRLQQDAPSGTPIEVLDEATGDSEWKNK
jgi:uncharacterized protein YdbL (DUF1318 family)